MRASPRALVPAFCRVPVHFDITIWYISGSRREICATNQKHLHLLNTMTSHLFASPRARHSRASAMAIARYSGRAVAHALRQVLRDIRCGLMNDLLAGMIFIEGQGGLLNTCLLSHMKPMFTIRRIYDLSRQCFCHDAAHAQ